MTYVGVSTAVVAYAGLETLAEYDDDDAIFATLGTDVLGSPWDKLVILAIVTSAIASTQTTIIPSSRTSFSMGRQSALPRIFAAVSPRFHTPWFSTAVIAGLAIAWYVPLNILSQNALYDTLSALSLMIAFYYALTGLACAVYYRRELTKSVKNFLFIGVGPLIGAAILGFLFVKSAIDLSDAENSYSGQAILGMGVPFVIGMGFILLGVVLLIVWRFLGNERFFGRQAVRGRRSRDREGAGMSRTIVVGVDGSVCADCAVRRAVELAAGLGDSLVLAYAVEPPFRSVGDEWREAQAALEEMGRPILDAALAKAAEAGVEAEGVLVPKRPTEALLALADERDARMIVVGSASERPLTGLILGSVPHKLVHRSGVPVLVVPPED